MPAIRISPVRRRSERASRNEQRGRDGGRRAPRSGPVWAPRSARLGGQVGTGAAIGGAAGALVGGSAGSKRRPILGRRSSAALRRELHAVHVCAWRHGAEPAWGLWGRGRAVWLPYPYPYPYYGPGYYGPSVVVGTAGVGAGAGAAGTVGKVDRVNSDQTGYTVEQTRRCANDSNDLNRCDFDECSRLNSLTRGGTGTGGPASLGPDGQSIVNRALAMISGATRTPRR